MLDKSIVGRQYAPFSVEVEKGRLRAFAKAIGETNPLYLDENAARAAGYRSLLAPPSFGWAIIMEADQGFSVLTDCGIDKARTVHGEQGFVYHNEICAGDVVNGRQTVVDYVEKKGGLLQIITTEIPLVHQDGRPLCDLRSVIVVRNG